MLLYVSIIVYIDRPAKIAPVAFCDHHTSSVDRPNPPASSASAMPFPRYADFEAVERAHRLSGSESNEGCRWSARGASVDLRGWVPHRHVPHKAEA